VADKIPGGSKFKWQPAVLFLVLLALLFGVFMLEAGRRSVDIKPSNIDRLRLDPL